MVKANSHKLDRLFFALSDSTRRSLLRSLANGEATVGQLSAPFDLAPATMSKHLKVLEEAGLVSRMREGRFLRTRLNPTPLRHGLDWMGEVRAMWDERLDQLQALLARERGGGR